MLKFTAAKYSSIVPDPKDSEDNNAVDAEFYKDINELLETYKSSMDALKFRSGLSTAMALSARGNQYLQDNSLDNALLANHPERCARVILNAINLIYILSVVFHPFMPSTTTEMLKQLNAPPRSLAVTFETVILPGHTIGRPDHLFKRIDPGMETEWRNKFGGEAAQAGAGVAKAGVAPAAAAAAAPGSAGLSKNQLAKQKKAEQKAQAAALAALKDAHKTPEVKALEQRMDKQKEIVKDLKTGKTNEGDVDAEVAELLKMKHELAALLKQLEATRVSA